MNELGEGVGAGMASTALVSNAEGVTYSESEWCVCVCMCLCTCMFVRARLCVVACAYCGRTVG